jgi:hypothetical protein
MTVQLALLKSGEEIIADIREIVDKDTGKQMSLVFIKPVRVTVQQPAVLNEQSGKTEGVLSFAPWIATSKDEEFFVPYEWCVTVCEANDDIKNSYIENVGVRDDSESNLIETEQPVSDSGD